MAATSQADDAAARPVSEGDLGVTFHHNVVTLKGAAIRKIEWIPGALMVSAGQGSGQNPTVTSSGDTWSIDVYCGRHKTSEVATAFNALNVSQDHMWNPTSSGDRKPAELNFYVGVTVEILVNGVSQFVPLYFAQGSNLWGNNWWVASPQFVAHPDHPRIIPFTAPSGQLLQVLGVSHSAANAFEVAPWFDRSVQPHDHRTWLATVNDALPIGQVNLPGTHDSAAIANWTASNPYVCHQTSLTNQMIGGVRLFDIRLKVKQDAQGRFYFLTCHGSLGSYLGVNEFQSFVSAMDEFVHYLGGFSSEFLVVSLKIDDWAGFESQEPAVYQALTDVLDAYKAQLLISPDLPTVKTARGKIFLLNRITGDLKFGAPLNVPNNTRGQKIGPAPPDRSFSYFIQDWYKDLPFIGYEQAKFEAWRDALQQVGAVDVVINFASATRLEAFKVMIIGSVLAHFGQNAAAGRPARIGWSLFDFETTSYQTTPYGALDIVDLVIASNFNWRGYDQAFVVNNTDKDEL